MAVILVTFQYKHKDAEGKALTLVSHGIDTETLEHVVLPPEPVGELGIWSKAYGEWVLRKRYLN